MKCTSTLFVSILIVCLSVFWASPNLFATTINVPGDQPAIQAAADAASAGDTILVANGTYNESVVINKSITIQAANPLGATVNGGTGNAFTASGITADITINGFNITTNTGHTGEVIEFLNVTGKVSILNNAFSDFGHDGKGAVVIETTTAITTDAVIQNNTFSGGGHNEAYVYINFDEAVATNGNIVIAGNTMTGMEDDAIEIDLNNTGTNVVRITNNNITGFTGTGSGIDYAVTNTSVGSTNFLLVKNNTLSDFESDGVIVSGGGTGNVYYWLIEDNTITNNAGAPANDDGILIRTQSSTGAAVVNATIKGNTIDNMGGDGIEIFLLSDDMGSASMFNVVVEDNSINDINNDGDIAGIFVDADDATNNNFNLNIDITLNTVTNLGAGCIVVDGDPGGGTVNLFEANNSCAVTTQGSVTTPGSSTVPSSSQLASLGDFVWNDTNGDGDQDGGESGIQGVSITAVGPGINQTVFTDADGNYFFPALPQQEYTLTIVLPSGFFLTPQDAGGNDDLDSDFNEGTNQAVVTLTNSVTNIDAGMTFDPCAVDAEPPVANCQDITVSLDGNGFSGIAASDVDGGSTDNCDIGTFSVDVFLFDCSDLGANPVTLTVTDGSSNSNNCQAIVTIVDELKPTVVCQDTTVFLDDTGQASITANDIHLLSDDNCGIETLSVDVMNFDCGDLGDNVVTLTAADASGNLATCQATVIVEDITPPVAICQDVVAFLNDTTGQGNIAPEDVDDGSSDNCGVITLSVSQMIFDTAGVNTVTLTVVDGSGNTATCTAIATILVGTETIWPNDWSMVARPNPFANNLQVSITAPRYADGIYQVTDLAGRRIAAGSFTAAEIQNNLLSVNAETWENGAYLLTIQMGDFSSRTVKVIRNKN